MPSCARARARTHTYSHTHSHSHSLTHTHTRAHTHTTYRASKYTCTSTRAQHVILLAHAFAYSRTPQTLHDQWRHRRINARGLLRGMTQHDPGEAADAALRRSLHECVFEPRCMWEAMESFGLLRELWAQVGCLGQIAHAQARVFKTQA